MEDIEDRLKRHYRSKHLDNDQLAQIAKEEAADYITTATYSDKQSERSGWAGIFSRKSDNSAVKHSFLARRQSLAVACVAMLVLAIGFGIHSVSSNNKQLEIMLHEVAMNHTTRLELEFAAESLANINTDMNQLEFDLRLPETISDNFTVVGARYCTLSGKLAAHVKLLNKSSNERVSVFMARADNELGSLRSTKEKVDGVDVSVWQESGLMYVLAAVPNG